jgi:hypothetical protein
MADRGAPAYPVRGSNPELEIVVGSFETDGTGAPVNTVGVGWSIGAPTTGVYTVTLRRSCTSLITMATLADSTTDANDTVRTGDEDAGTGSTAATFTITTASAAGTDANLDGPRVSFVAYMISSDSVR